MKSLSPAILTAWGLFVALSAAAAPSSPETAKATTVPSCQELVEQHCDTLWSPPNFGNYTTQGGSFSRSLRYGKTPNDIDYRFFRFLEALRQNQSRLPADLQQALRKNRFAESLTRYLSRKPRAKFTEADLSREEWLRSPLATLDDVMSQVASTRTEKQHPGYLRWASEEISMEVNRDYYKNLDLLWSETFTAIWKDSPPWRNVKTLFEALRAEYLEWVRQSADFPPALKAQLLQELQTVSLRIPGSHPVNANSSSQHTCGINQDNAYYNKLRHDLTVCAGDFNGSGYPLLSIAHELGHVAGVSRRLLNYWRNSAIGKDLLQLWTRSCEGKHLSCEEWETQKKNLLRNAEAMAPIIYEDAPVLERWVTKELSPIPQGEELRKVARRLASSTMRSEITNRYLEVLIQKDEMLPIGKTVPNQRYLRTCFNDRWPLDLIVLDQPDYHFELYFTQDYHCRLEKNLPKPVALEEAIQESRRLTEASWALLLRAQGRFSPLQDAQDEGFTQDVEEDMADAYASTVVARHLRKMPSLPERRAAFLAAISGQCDPPSFVKRYPAEAQVFQKLSNRPHSVGLDRRRKILTPEIRETLECQ